MTDEQFLQDLKIQSGIEQAISGLVNMAVLLHRYYAALKDEGFTPQQAMSIVLDFQRQ